MLHFVAVAGKTEKMSRRKRLDDNTISDDELTDVDTAKVHEEKKSTMYSETGNEFIIGPALREEILPSDCNEKVKSQTCSQAVVEIIQKAKSAVS